MDEGDFRFSIFNFRFGFGDGRAALGAVLARGVGEEGVAAVGTGFEEGMGGAVALVFIIEPK